MDLLQIFPPIFCVQALAQTLDKSSEECDRQAPNSTPTKAATFSLLRDDESGMKLLEEINDLFKNSSDFLLEVCMPYTCFT